MMDRQEMTQMEIKNILTKCRLYYTKNKVNKFIVIHYTSNTAPAENNCKYYQREDSRQASANYFVDENSICCSVLPKYSAWHCGTKGKYYNNVRNTNSIGIEMCCSKKDGKMYVSEDTISNVAWLVQKLMKDYGIPEEHIVRHFDVTHKACPNVNGLLKYDNWINFRHRISKGSTDNKPAPKKEEHTYYTQPGVYRVTLDKHVIRNQPDPDAKVVGAITDKGSYTIVAVKNHYGLLKAYKDTKDHWINLRTDYVKKV